MMMRGVVFYFEIRCVCGFYNFFGCCIAKTGSEIIEGHWLNFYKGTLFLYYPIFLQTC